MRGMICVDKSNEINNQKYVNDRFVKIREVCNRTGFCMQTIRNAIKKKELRGYLINNRWYTTERDYDKYIADTFSKSILGIDINKAKAVMDLLEKEEMLKKQKYENKEEIPKSSNNSGIDNLDLYKELEKKFYSEMMNKLQF